MIKVKVKNYLGQEVELTLHFFLVKSRYDRNSYVIKLREKGSYDKRIMQYGRDIHDITYLVDCEKYTLDKSTFSMMHPECDPFLVSVMIKEFQFRDYHQMYHGSQDNDFWSDPVKELKRLSTKYAKPYSPEEAQRLIDLCKEEQ